MKELYYVGMDIHKKKIAYCIKTKEGHLIGEGEIDSCKAVLERFARGIDAPWIGAMEATMFTGYVYDTLVEYAKELKVANPLQLKAISASKKKNDRVDARKICDLLRVDLLPECYMSNPKIRELRRVLRYRNLLVREGTRFKNKTAGLLMELGIDYNKSRLHGKKYFNALVDNLHDVPASVKDLLTFNRSTLELFKTCQLRLINGLVRHHLLHERVERLTTIPGVGVVMALTWALEIGDPERFTQVKQSVSYCGLTSAQRESGDKSLRGPISKQRNKHLQWMVIECAKLAARTDLRLLKVYETALEKGNRNKATLAVARKLVAYLLAVDKSGNEFVPRAL